jgi:hypothetical protein
MLSIRKSTEAIISKNSSKILDDDRIYKESERQYNRLKRETVVCLLMMVSKHPTLLRAVLYKVVNLIEILWNRLQGLRVRW